MCDFLVPFRSLAAVKRHNAGEVHGHRAPAREINRERIGGFA
jgi:hypothetical protein